MFWVSVLLAIYGAALLVGSPICGIIADRTTTRRAPLLVGLLVFAGATALLAIGTSVPLLVVGRLLQGLSGAIVWTTGLALLVDTVGPKHVGQYMGYLSLSLSLAILLGPLLGGVVFATAGASGYESVFAMCWALIGADIVLRVLMIEKKVAKKWLPDEDTLPSTSRSEANTAEVDKETTQEVPDDDAASVKEDNCPEQASSGIRGDDIRIDAAEDQIHSMTPAHQHNPAAPLPPDRVALQRTHTRASTVLSKVPLPAVLTLLASRRLLVALYGTLVQASLLTAFDSTLPLYVRQIFHFNSLGAGLLFLPIVIPNGLAPLVGHFADRYGPRWLAAVGFLLAVPFLVLLRFVDHDSLKQKVLLCALLALFGASVVMGFAPLMAEISYVVEAKEKNHPGKYGRMGAYAQAYALWNMAFAAGCLVGPIWGGMVNESFGWGTMGWTLAIWAGTTAVPIFLWTGGWIGKGTKTNMGTREGWGDGPTAADEEQAAAVGAHEDATGATRMA
ncbi:MAG: hypothetical protein M1828_004863 [Chrysothrix sp. TS-e1954]|nr:MAG: hypothetical protein M1828_004863 [Chrysothrix sp. TS-e1954]